MCQHLAREAQDLEAAALPALDALTAKVDTQSLERVRRVKTRLVRLKTRVSAVRPRPPTPTPSSSPSPMHIPNHSLGKMKEVWDILWADCLW